MASIVMLISNSVYDFRHHLLNSSSQGCGNGLASGIAVVRCLIGCI